MLRRVKKEDGAEVNRFRFGDMSVNFDRAELLKAGRPVPLAGKELHLLRYLIENRGRVISRDELLREVWEYSGNVSSRTVDVHIAWLRQKLESDPHSPSHIHTIRGSGYRFSL
jgi:two-component system alkaline phosphatase synthesis response regulator PhoP